MDKRRLKQIGCVVLSILLVLTTIAIDFVPVYAESIDDTIDKLVPIVDTEATDIENIFESYNDTLLSSEYDELMKIVDKYTKLAKKYLG